MAAAADCLELVHGMLARACALGRGNLSADFEQLRVTADALRAWVVAHPDWAHGGDYEVEDGGARSEVWQAYTFYFPAAARLNVSLRLVAEAGAPVAAALDALELHTGVRALSRYTFADGAVVDMLAPDGTRLTPVSGGCSRAADAIECGDEITPAERDVACALHAAMRRRFAFQV